MLGGLGAALSVDLAPSERLPVHAAAIRAKAPRRRLLLGSKDIVGGSWRVEGDLVRSLVSPRKYADRRGERRAARCGRPSPAERLARAVPVTDLRRRRVKTVRHTNRRAEENEC
jgi:hypothetical protein